MSHPEGLAPWTDDTDGLPRRRFPAVDDIAGIHPRMARSNAAGRFSVNTNGAQSSIIAESLGIRAWA